MKVGRLIGMVLLGIITLGLAILTVELLLKGEFSDRFWVGLVGTVAFGYVTYGVYKPARNKK